MKNILLANLGNRNLYYRNTKGDYLTIVNYIKEVNLQQYILLNETFATEEYDFRQFTKDIWEQMEAGIFDDTLVDPRTLTASDLCEHPYEHVYLFYTDQQGTRFEYQDTLYEALILQRLFKKKLPNLPVELILIAGNPSDEKNLYVQYTPILKSLLTQHPDVQIVFHDVGGTTQMKLVTKTLLEYYLRQQQRKLTIRYKDHWSEDARESDRSLHSRYLLLDMAGEFIRHFQFKAATDVLARIADTDLAVQQLRYHTQLADDRINFRFRPTPTEYATSVQKSIPVFEIWSKKIVPTSFLPDLPNSERINLFEFATICAFYFQVGNYTLGVATYYRLCEELCQAFVRSENKYSLNSKDDRDAFSKSVFPQVSLKLAGSGSPPYGVPILLAYASLMAKPDRLKAVYNCMIPTISHVNGSTKLGLNYLRNRCWLAHNNQAIDEKAIQAEVPGFIVGKNILGQLFNRMGLPDENAFISMKKSLLTELMDY